MSSNLIPLLVAKKTSSSYAVSPSKREETVDENQCLEDNVPVTCLVQSSGDGRHACSYWLTGEGRGGRCREYEDITDVFVIGWMTVMTGCFFDLDLDLCLDGGRRTYFGDTHCRFILHCFDRFLESVVSHFLPLPASPLPILLPSPFLFYFPSFFHNSY